MPDAAVATRFKLKKYVGRLDLVDGKLVEEIEGKPAPSVDVSTMTIARSQLPAGTGQDD